MALQVGEFMVASGVKLCPLMEEQNLAVLRFHSREKATRRIGRTLNLATEPRSDWFHKEMGRMNANSW